MHPSYVLGEVLHGRSGGYRGEDRQGWAADQGGGGHGAPQRGGVPGDPNARAPVQRRALAAAAGGRGGRQPGDVRRAGRPRGDPPARAGARHGVPGADRRRPPPRRGGGPVEAVARGQGRHPQQGHARVLRHQRAHHHLAANHADRWLPSASAATGTEEFSDSNHQKFWNRHKWVNLGNFGPGFCFD